MYRVYYSRATQLLAHQTETITLARTSFLLHKVSPLAQVGNRGTHRAAPPNLFAQELPNGDLVYYSFQYIVGYPSLGQQHRETAIGALLNDPFGVVCPNAPQ